MAEEKQVPTFNLGAIMQETGIKADTLRAWERRYGLPKPQRSPGGHRLYTRRDIDTVKWLMARQEEKMSISQAVKLWNSLESEGEDPLLRQPVSAPSAVPSIVPPGGAETLMKASKNWVAACKAFDEAKAESVLSQAFALYPPEIVCFEVLLKGLGQIGDDWYQGEATVQQEHFASQLATRRLEALIAANPPPTRNVRVVVAAPPTEEHDLVLLLIVLLLRRRGLDVVYLGRNVPVADMEAVVETTRPVLAISAAQRLVTAAQLSQMAGALRRLGVPTYYGGQIFDMLPELRAMLPAHYLGDQFEQVVQIVDAALLNPPAPPRTKSLTTEYQEALAHFSQLKPIIEAQALRQLANQIDDAELRIVDLSKNIEAALLLGDINLMNYELNWMQGADDPDSSKKAQLVTLIEAYRQAATDEMDARGRPLLTWLERFTFHD